MGAVDEVHLPEDGVAGQRSEDLRAKGRRASVWALVTRPAWRFIRDYFIYSGWRDGIQGFIAAVLSSFAAFLKYAFLFDQGGSKSV